MWQSLGGVAGPGRTCAGCPEGVPSGGGRHSPQTVSGVQPGACVQQVRLPLWGHEDLSPEKTV